MRRPTVIRCSVPDCEWGFKIQDFSRMDQCYQEYERYCIQMHGADAESYIQFDLENLMLSLKR